MPTYMPPSPTPQLLAGDLRALDPRLELRPHDARVHLLRAGEGGEAAIGAGDDVLAPDHLGVAPDTLGHQFGVLDQHSRVADDAGDERLALWQPGGLPQLPLMLVARVGGLEGNRPATALKDDGDEIAHI